MDPKKGIFVCNNTDCSHPEWFFVEDPYKDKSMAEARLRCHKCLHEMNIIYLPYKHSPYAEKLHKYRFLFTAFVIGVLSAVVVSTGYPYYLGVKGFLVMYALFFVFFTRMQGHSIRFIKHEIPERLDNLGWVKSYSEATLWIIIPTVAIIFGIKYFA